MPLIPICDKQLITGQKIKKIVIDGDSVEFVWDIKNGGASTIDAPLNCIKELIEKIEKGVKEGSVQCREEFSYMPTNYVGGTIKGEKVKLTYEEEGKYKAQIISIASLLKIRKYVK